MKKVKKILAIAMIVATATTTCTFTGIIPENNLSVSAAEEVMKTDDGFQYEVNNNGEITITRYIGTDTDVDIPSKIDGKPVTNIGDCSFYNCNNLMSVTIPDSVTSIGERAFEECSSLKNITIPDSVTNIGNYAFTWCSSLKNITISNSVTSIGNYAFYNCKSLTNITIPNSVTSIGKSAFHGCSNLTNINIPNSVTSIEDSMFYYCSKLTNITIPNTVTSIGESAFSLCDNLTNITIPDSVTSIGESAFSNCNGLTSIIIPNSVTSIEDFTFGSCNSLTNIAIPDSVTSIGKSVFCDCSSITNINIPNSVTSIEADTFSGCSSLTNIAIPDSVTSIGESAFYDCTSLTNITIPSLVTSIGQYTFFGCENLENIKVDKDNKNYADEDGVLFTKDKSVLVRYPGGKDKGLSYEIPSFVTSIGNYAFNGYLHPKSIIIPDSMTSIGNYAFSGFYGLTNITIPDSVTSIGAHAFDHCENLESIKIPNSVTTIKEYTFSYCGPLEITIPRSVTTIEDNAFNYCLATIYGYKDSYAETFAQNHSFEFKEIQESEQPLGITSFTADKASPQISGTKVTLTANATSQGALQYKFIVRDNETGNWYKLRDFEESNTFIWKTGNTGNKTLYVDVKDETGEVIREAMNYKIETSVEAPAPKIISFNADKISPQLSGTQIKLTVNATGSGKLQYKFIIRDNKTGNWYKLRDYAESNIFTWKTGNEGDKTLYVDVKDENGKITRESMSYTVKK